MTGQILRGSDAILEIGRKIFPGFHLDDPDLRLNYEKAFYCFTGHEKAAQYGLNPEKALLLLGDIGVGKTMLMRVMQILMRESERRFKWARATDFKDMLEAGMSVAEIKELYGAALKCDLYIDDIGFGRAEFSRFGNVVNVISEIIFERDELYVNERFRTHFSSNLPTTVQKEAPQEIKSIERVYGDRALDRMKQMTNLFHWPGKSKRK